MQRKQPGQTDSDGSYDGVLFTCGTLCRCLCCPKPAVSQIERKVDDVLAKQNQMLQQQSSNRQPTSDTAGVQHIVDEQLEHTLEIVAVDNNTSNADRGDNLTDTFWFYIELVTLLIWLC